MFKMRKLTFIIFIAMMLSYQAGCGYINNNIDFSENTLVDDNEIVIEQNEESDVSSSSPSPEVLQYNSLEEFINDIRKVKMGEATGELADIAERMNLASIDRVYVPTGIPDSYKIFNVAVSENSVTILFMPEEHLTSISSQMDAVIVQQHFAFNFTRMSFEDPLAGVMQQLAVTEEGLLEGKLLFDSPNSITWGYDGRMMHLYLPLPSDTAIADIRCVTEESMLQSLGLDSKSDLIRFTPVEVVDLID